MELIQLTGDAWVILQVTLAVTLKVALPAAAVTGILLLSAESCLAAAAWVRVMRSVSVAPAPVASSVRIASLDVSAVFSSYTMVIC